VAIFIDTGDEQSHPRGAREEELARASLEATPVRVVFTAIPTLLAVADAIGGRGSGVPTRWVRRARHALGGIGPEALRPVVERPGGFVPDSLLALPNGGAADADPTPALRRIATMAGRSLLEELEGPGAPGVVGPWVSVAANPSRWAIRYVSALHRIWKQTQAEIRGASALIDREVERVGAAAAKGALLPLLSDLHPGSGVDDRSGQQRVADDGLTLIPRLAGSGSPLMRAYRNGGLSHVAYSVPGAARVLDDGTAGSSSLDALVGAQRARLLRCLDKPATVGSLAEVLIACPATATHHVATLEAAGLVSRERQGRKVLVHRTARGTSLLALY
jgi:DNA-binding transcriptional ArsR family regulator